MSDSSYSIETKRKKQSERYRQRVRDEAHRDVVR